MSRSSHSLHSKMIDRQANRLTNTWSTAAGYYSTVLHRLVHPRSQKMHSRSVFDSILSFFTQSSSLLPLFNGIWSENYTWLVWFRKVVPVDRTHSTSSSSTEFSSMCSDELQYSNSSQVQWWWSWGRPVHDAQRNSSGKRWLFVCNYLQVDDYVWSGARCLVCSALLWSLAASLLVTLDFEPWIPVAALSLANLITTSLAYWLNFFSRLRLDLVAPLTSPQLIVEKHVLNAPRCHNLLSLNIHYAAPVQIFISSPSTAVAAAAAPVE